MKEFIKEQHDKAFNKYMNERHNYENAIKGAVKEAAEVGLNEACVVIQARWYEGKIIERYLTELGCRNITVESNYSWKYIKFTF